MSLENERTPANNIVLAYNPFAEELTRIFHEHRQQRKKHPSLKPKGLIAETKLKKSSFSASQTHYPLTPVIYQHAGAAFQEEISWN